MSVYFLSWESKQVHAPFEGGNSTVEQQDDELPMSHGHDSLMSRCPDSVPGPIKRIWDGWAQHVVQIHFCNLRKQQEIYQLTIFLSCIDSPKNSENLENYQNNQKCSDDTPLLNTSRAAFRKKADFHCVFNKRIYAGT